MTPDEFKGATPGPWEQSSQVVYGEHGQGPSAGQKGFVVAEAYTDADAALIAAAPDLLSDNIKLREALEKIMEMDWRDPQLMSMGGSQAMAWSAALNRCKCIARTALAKD
jgi:hypothetical protein